MLYMYIRLIKGAQVCSLYIYIIHIPNPGLIVAVFVRKVEQGRFKGSRGEYFRAVQGRSRWASTAG